MTFANRLKKRLKDRNLAMVARELKIPKSVLHDWTGGKSPSFKNVNHLKALATYLGLTLDELLISEEDERIISAVTFEDQGRKYRVKVERVK